MVRDVHALPPFVVEGFLGKRVVVDPAAPTPAAWRAEMSPPKRWPQYRLRATAGRQVRRRRVPDRSAQASPLPPKNQRPIGSGQSGDREPIAIRVPPLAPWRGRWALPTRSGPSGLSLTVEIFDALRAGLTAARGGDQPQFVHSLASCTPEWIFEEKPRTSSEQKYDHSRLRQQSAK